MNNENTSMAIERENLHLAADIVISYVSNNAAALSPDAIPDFLAKVYNAVSATSGIMRAVNTQRPEPAVPIRRSVTPEYIICLEDGKRLKMLKRHLRTAYNMSPEEYRARWNLPADYPMTAPAYVEKRRDLAKKIGLGRKPGEKVAKKK